MPFVFDKHHVAVRRLELGGGSSRPVEEVLNKDRVDLGRLSDFQACYEMLNYLRTMRCSKRRGRALDGALKVVGGDLAACLKEVRSRRIRFEYK